MVTVFGTIFYYFIYIQLSTFLSHVGGDYGLDDIRSIPSKTKMKYSLSDIGPGAHAASYPASKEDSFPEVKWPGRETDRSSPPNADIYNMYRVIHKFLRDFRTRLRNKDRHGRKEHINR